MVNWTSVSVPRAKSIEPSTFLARCCEVPIFERNLPSARKRIACGRDLQPLGRDFAEVVRLDDRAQLAFRRPACRGR